MNTNKTAALPESLKDLRADVCVYLDKLEQRHPFYTTKRFKQISYEKAACKEILGEIDASVDLPFQMEAIDILMMLKHRYDSAPANIMCFSCGADIIDGFISLYDTGEEVQKE